MNMRTSDLRSITLNGWAAERLERARLAMDNFGACLWWHAPKPPGWGYEAPLRWMRNMCLLYRYNGYRHPRIAEVFDRVMTLAPADAARRIRGTGKGWCLHLESQFISPLIQYHTAFNDERAMEAAIKIGRNLRSEKTHGEIWVIAMLIDKLVCLAEATGDESFAANAVRIAEEQQLRLLKLPNTNGAAGAKILSGYVHLYQHTGNRRYLDWALKGWKAFRARMWATGGIPEHLDFTAPPSESALHGEACQTVDWFLLNLDLWEATGRNSYLDLAERIFYNQYLAHQHHAGEGPGFSAMNDIDQGFRGNHNFICCDNEGMLGLFYWISQIFAHPARDKGLQVNWLVPADTEWELPDGTPIRVRLQTDYPVAGRALLVVHTPHQAGFAARIRIPDGAAPECRVLVNDKPLLPKLKGSYVTLDRTWKNTDTVSLVFPIRQRVETDNTGKGPVSAAVRINGKSVKAKRIAVMHGPAVAALFRTSHGNDLSWVWTGDYPEVPDSGGSVYEGYPGSRSDVLETDRALYHTGGVPDQTEISGDADRAVTLCWSRTIRKPMRENEFTKTVTVTHEVRVRPGLPVRMDCLERIAGWGTAGEQQRMLSAGVRFGVLKTNVNQVYKGKQMGWYYPFPSVTTKPDLNHIGGCENGNGTFGAYDRMTEYGVLPKTGVWMMNNGYFRVICLYDPKPVERLTTRATPHWAGIYIEPRREPDLVLTRTLVFPLHAAPMAQHLVREQAERTETVRARIRVGRDGKRTLVLKGPMLEDMPLILDRASGLKPGDLIVNNRHASPVYHYDDRRVVAVCDMPGNYRIEQRSCRK